MTGKGQLITSEDGTKIWADASGDSSKPAVVFVHGLCGTAMNWDKQFAEPELLESLYMIRYDLRGHGRSDHPLEEELYASTRFAQDFKSVCDTFNVKKPYLAGWSVGAVLATDVTTLYGIDALTGIMFLSGFPYLGMHREIVHPVILSIVPDLMNPDALKFSEAVKKYVYSLFAPSRIVPFKDFCASMGVIVAQHPVVRTYSRRRPQDPTALLSIAETIPVLAVQGSEDQHIDLTKHEPWMKAHFGRLEYHTIEGAGHMAFYEKPEEANRLILKFIERVTTQMDAKPVSP